MESETSFIEKTFQNVKRAFHPLENIHVVLIRRKLRGATMNARPVFGFRGLRLMITHYQIIVAEHPKDAEELRVDGLPEDVLSGWIAHELGHVMDYKGRSVMDMISFGIRYLTNDTFRKKAEYRADHFAIKHGFHNEIIAAKQFIIDHELLSPAYKAKINRYYMPVEEVRWHTENPNILKNLM